MRTRAAFDELRQGVKDIEFLADPTSGEVRIGCAAAASATLLRPIIRRFSEAYPTVALHVTDVPPAVSEHSGLRERRYDLLLGWRVMPFSSNFLGDDVNVEFLFEDRLVVVAGLQSKWARRRKVDLAELVNERWMLGPPNTANYVDMMEAFRARGLAVPKVALESVSVPLRTYLLATGPFVNAMVKSIASQSQVKILPVELPVRPWPFAIFTLKNRTLSPVAERFIQHLRDCTK
jgi:DNA-binding transcriptional LysR family regulator